MSTFDKKFGWLSVQGIDHSSELTPNTEVIFTPDEHTGRSPRIKDIRLHIGDKYEDFKFTQKSHSLMLTKELPAGSSQTVEMAEEASQVSFTIKAKANSAYIIMTVERITGVSTPQDFNDFVKIASVIVKRLDNGENASVSKTSWDNPSTNKPALRIGADPLTMFTGIEISIPVSYSIATPKPGTSYTDRFTVYDTSLGGPKFTYDVIVQKGSISSDYTKEPSEFTGATFEAEDPTPAEVTIKYSDEGLEITSEDITA